MNKNLIILILLLLLIGGGLLLFKTNNKNKILYKETENYLIVKDNLSKSVSKLGDSLFSQKTAITSNKKIIEERSKNIDNLKKINGYLEIKLKAALKEKDTIYVDVLVYLDPETNISYLELPYSFGEESQYYTYKFNFTKNGEIIREKLEFNDSDLEIGIGYKKVKFWQIFKDLEPITTVKSNNPYISPYSIESIQYEKSPRILELGGQVGYGITPRGFQPYLGLGLSINL